MDRPPYPAARTLDLVGDRWCLLIIRDAMDGARSFTDFRHRTGVARNILTDRSDDWSIMASCNGRRRNQDVARCTYSPTPDETSFRSSWRWTVG